MRLKRTKKNVYAYSYFSITDTLNFYKNIYIYIRAQYINDSYEPA
jgi:hypothetical protein